MEIMTEPKLDFTEQLAFIKNGLCSSDQKQKFEKNKSKIIL